MNFITSYASPEITNELPDKQSPWPDRPEPGQPGPLNPTPDAPGADAPEVSTGSRMDEDIPAEETDENKAGGSDSEKA